MSFPIDEYLFQMHVGYVLQDHYSRPLVKSGIVAILTYLSINHSLLTTKYISTSFSKILQAWTNMCTFSNSSYELL